MAQGNQLECPSTKGVKECAKEAEKFCEEKKFKIKSGDNNYEIVCLDGEKADPPPSDKKMPSDSSNKTTNNGNIQSNSPRWRFALGMGYNSKASAESDLIVTNISNGASVSGTVEFDAESALSLEAEGRFLRKHGWGVILGADLDLKREVQGGSITLGSTTVVVSESSDPDRFTALVLYGNAVYQWEQFYIPFGINLSYLDYESTGLTVNSTPSGGIQLGAGFEFHENFATEIFARALGFKLDYLDPGTGLNVEFDEGVITDIALRIKYIF